MRSRIKGFTLIELLVVISIIALLLSIMMPSLSRAKELARRTVCASDQKSIGTAIMVYANKNNDLLPKSYYMTGGNLPSASYTLFYLDPAAKISWSPKKRIAIVGGKDQIFNFGYLFTNNIIENPKVFYCPSTPHPVEMSGPYSVSYRYEQYSNDGTFPWNNSFEDTTAWNRFTVRSSYNYIPQNAKAKALVDTSKGKGYFPKMAEKSFELDSNHVLSCDYLFRKDMLPHKNGKKATGVNALFSDCSVKYVNKAEAFDNDLWNDAGEASGYARVGNDEYTFRKIISLFE